ncbi:MAG: hypothetical protein H7175_03085 [Burkholderiales bacterium]|nr:hypothetical protein [Anaerolineae bacterium]
MNSHNRYFTIGWLALMIVTIVAVVLAVALPATAQDNTPPIAAVSGNDIWLYGFDNAPEQATDIDSNGFSNLVWSPGGQQLAFTAYNENFQPTLMLLDRSSDSTVVLTNQFSAMFPATFSTDGSQLIYAVENYDAPVDPAQQENGAQNIRMDVYAVDVTNGVPAEGATPTLLGGFLFGNGCGGGSPFPTDWAYWEESGFGGSSVAFMMTPHGLIHNLNCGSSTTALLNLQSGEDITLGSNFSRVKLSSDGSQLLGINNSHVTPEGYTGQLAIVDLTTQAVTELANSAMPDQVAWGVAGSSEVFYSSRQVAQSDLGLSPEQQQTASTQLGYVDATELAVPVGAVEIHRLNTQTSSDEVIYSADAYAIGDVMISPEGDALLFSQVPNLNNFVEGLANGTLDYMSANGDELAREAVQTELYRLNLSDNSVELVGDDISQAAVYRGM